jgi:hypothetical protein
MYAILAVWFAWLLALWCERQFRAAFPIIDPQLFEQPTEGAGHENIQ